MRIRGLGLQLRQRGRKQSATRATDITQWLEVLEHDYSHPSIVGWYPLNESWQLLHDRITILDDVMRGMFLTTKAFDSTRPVLDTSGYSHRVRESDVCNTHYLCAGPRGAGETVQKSDQGQAVYQHRPAGLQAHGQPALRGPASFCERVWRHLVESRVDKRGANRGATGGGPSPSRNFIRASKGCAACCSITRRCSVTATHN